MTYFKNFSTVKYDFTNRRDATPIIETIVDVTSRVHLNISEKDLNALCEEYIVGDGITPEMIAASLYNDPFLHWTILYINNIADIHKDWPLSDIALNAFITKKYGVGNENNIHHYETEAGVTIDVDFAQSTYGTTPIAITNYDYEHEKNELKRHIKIIKPAFISKFVQLFKDKLVNG